MKIPLPTTDVGPAAPYLRSLVQSITQELEARVPDTTPKASVLLASPNGSVYSVTVTDAGVVTATKVSQL